MIKLFKLHRSEANKFINLPKKKKRPDEEGKLEHDSTSAKNGRREWSKDSSLSS
jgi:hypothetical protein